MINHDEIDQKSQEFEINSSNVERDYVFGWLLFGLFTVSSLKDSLFLKGGNALRKGYFESTRYSKDLDFGIPGDISKAILLGEVNKVCDFIREKVGITFINTDNKIEEKFTATDAPIVGLRVYELRVYFKDFYGNQDHIRLKISMDVTRFDRVLLPIQKVKLIHPYSDAKEVVCEIRCMKLEEIIATKLKCLLQREHAPDLFDYVYSIKLLGGNLNKEEVAATLIKKTIFYRNPCVLKHILHEMSFDYFRECWDDVIICAKQILFGFEEAISAFLTDLDVLFKAYPDNGYAQFAYFEPKLRIPIMDAGRTQTLLKMHYRGSERMVEPYSLKYLQRRDGAEREYFYAYNCSGGDHGPGMRCFVSDGIESIENTEETFEPRYQIELCKAGERPENPYLFDPNKPTPAPRSGWLSRKSSYGPRYIYQCSYCGKKFSKKTHDASLGAHKNKNGYPCGGRSGYYVDTKY